jgi:two-component system, OmpR family, phosphate regulon response regulator OmpR
MTTVLVVDDDPDVCDLVTYKLRKSGYEVRRAMDGDEAIKSVAAQLPDIVLLDVMMPGENGLDLARDLKATRSIPICMLTARSEPEHRIEGLETGVDDYIPKPFEPRELLLRLRNILRRGAGPTGPHDEIRMGANVFHVGRGELRHGDETVKLTERERDLLRLFAQRIGTPIARHELFAEDSTGSDRAIDVQINRLRRKIETDPSNPVYLQTVRGKGYILYSD